MKTYQVDKNGYYGEFGGAYVPEILHQCVENLQNTYLQVLESDSFKEEFDQLLRDYVGRPSPLYLAKRLSEKYGCKIYLKREDLNHTGAHKINNTIGQILLARRMGKTRIIAETGAGQHGVATATVCALMNMECIVYMGKTDVERQHANVQKMEMLGATVVPVTSGNMTLKDATNEAIRDWQTLVRAADNRRAVLPAFVGNGHFRIGNLHTLWSRYHCAVFHQNLYIVSAFIPRCAGNNRQHHRTSHYINKSLH